MTGVSTQALLSGSLLWFLGKNKNNVRGIETRLASTLCASTYHLTASLLVSLAQTQEPAYRLACIKLNVLSFCSLLDENPVDHRNVKLKAIKERFVLLLVVADFR